MESFQYSGNSFSLGAATRLGVSDSKMAFMQYIQTPWKRLSWGSSLLSSGGVMDATGINNTHNFCLTGCALGVSCRWAFSVVTFACDILHLYRHHVLIVASCGHE